MELADYTIAEHKHRFACWTAARAAQRGHKGLTTKNVVKWMESPTLATLHDCAGGPQYLPAPNAFDDSHLQWCKALIAASETAEPSSKISFGRAAKIVNVYIKTCVIDAGSCRSESVAAVHPPIDRQLLRKLKSQGWLSQLPTKPWTNFSECEYYSVIEQIKTALHGKNSKAALWQAEYLWFPEEN